MAKKRKRVPEVLWRIFGKRARTLAETILAWTPPECRCEGRRCISCSGDKAVAFHIRPADSFDFHKLLNGCFVVVSENAPPVPVFDPHCRWSQREIVRRSIETILHEQPSSSNLICFNYDKASRSSHVVDELTSSKWKVLLKRVGDDMMVYLLKYTSLFLPLPRKKYHQISGFAISDLHSKISKHMLEPNPQHHPLVCNGLLGSKKRKRVEELVSTSPKQQLNTRSLGSEPLSNSVSVVTGNGSCCLSMELSHKESEGSLKENACPLSSEPSSNSVKVVAGNGSSCVSMELSRTEKEGSLKENIVLSRKRTRMYRRKRQEKRRQWVVREAPSLIAWRGNDCNSNNSSLSTSQSDPSNIPQCYCCSVVQNELKMKRNAEIDRRHMFYRLENSTLMLPRNHILYSLRPNDAGASILFNNIFGTLSINQNPGAIPFFRSKNGCPFSSCLYHTLLTLLKRLIRVSQNCQHLRLLEKHCSIRTSYQDAKAEAGTGREGNDSEINLSLSKQDVAQSDGKLFHAANSKNCNRITTDQIEPTKCCPKKDIVSFIWAICRRIVPPPLLGEPSNWRVLRSNISKFIHLRRYEKFSLKECTYKLRISKFPLFSIKQTGCCDCGVTDKARYAIFGCWIFWVFAHLVLPLAQANFYVTESEHEKKEVLYYPKLTWEKMMGEAECLKDGRYHLLNHASARGILGNRSFGFSRARLLPKKNGFRMLTNLRAPSRMPVKPLCSKSPSSRRLHRKAFCNHRGNYRFFKSVNSALHDLHVVLKGVRAKEAEKLGSSVFDYNDVYRKFVPYLFLLKNGSTNMQKPNVFMVVSDVSKAFDSVNQDKLLSVMKDIIVDEEFTLEKFTEVVCTRKSLMVNQHQTSSNEDVVTASTSFRSRFRVRSFDSVVVKKELGRKIRKEKMNSILKEHITRNVVQLGNNFYLQRVGIPQGSVLSSLLCSLYYGHMERNVVYPFLKKANGDLCASTSGCNHKKDRVACSREYLLLRFIDDFLFMSTSEKQASMFFTRLERGFRGYNCCMNEEKYGLNFIMNKRQGCHSSRLHIGQDGISFLRWSGLLVNCTTLEIQADYTRYLNFHLSSTLTVISQGKVGSNLKSKLHGYLRPKCHPLFYDSNINSAGVVRLNIYQSFLLCAMKFISYITHLSVLPTFTTKFCIKAIYTSLRYMCRLIKRKVYCIEVEAAFRPKYDVKKEEIIWLGLYAYSRALRKKQSRYKDLLRLLRFKLNAFGKVDSMSPEMKYAIDDAHSSVLWGIKY